jgi:hypothetical protein
MSALAAGGRRCGVQPVFRRWAKGALPSKQVHRFCALLLEVARYGLRAHWTRVDPEQVAVLVAFALSADFRAVDRGVGRDVVLRLDVALAASEEVRLRHELWLGVFEGMNIYDAATEGDFLVDAMEASSVAAWRLAVQLLLRNPTGRREARERLRLGIHLLGQGDALPAETRRSLFDTVVSALPPWIVESVAAEAVISAAEETRRALQLELVRERAAVQALAEALRDAELGRSEALAHLARVSGSAAGQLPLRNADPVWACARFSV